MPYWVSHRVPIWRVHHSETNPPMDPISHEALHCTPNQHSQDYLSSRNACGALPKRCVASKVCFLQYPIFPCAHLGGSARDLPKRPKQSTYVESKVIGVESLCLERLVDYSIQAEDIIIYLCTFQGSFACLFANFAVFGPS